jgi:hypothetical protein
MAPAKKGLLTAINAAATTAPVAGGEHACCIFLLCLFLLLYFHLRFAVCRLKPRGVEQTPQPRPTKQHMGGRTEFADVVSKMGDLLELLLDGLKRFGTGTLRLQQRHLSHMHEGLEHRA